jgi:hypothetical protein
MWIKLGNRRYRLVKKPLPKKPVKIYGLCDEPTKRGKTITIATGLSEFDELDTIIHECIHGLVWHIDEAMVDQAATDIARVLIRNGFGKRLP